VIDTPPNADMAAREAVGAADIILVPVRARAFDLHAVATTAALVKGASSPAWVLFNAMPARAPRLLEEATDAVGPKGLSVCPEVLTERARFTTRWRRAKLPESWSPAARPQPRSPCCGMAALTG
jgi:chromosome partitioning protein